MSGNEKPKREPGVPNVEDIFPGAKSVGSLPRESETQVLQEAAQIRQRKQQELNQRMQELMSGQSQPPNEFVGYLLEKLKECRMEHDAVQRNIRELSQRLKQMEERALMLIGQHDKYVADIQQWDRPLEKETKEQPKEN